MYKSTLDLYSQNHNFMDLILQAKHLSLGLPVRFDFQPQLLISKSTVYLQSQIRLFMELIFEAKGFSMSIPLFFNIIIFTTVTRVYVDPW